MPIHKFLAVIANLLIGSIAFILAYEQAYAADMGTYESYTESVDKACYARAGWSAEAPAWNTPVDGEVPEELITMPRFIYPDIYAPDVQKRYQEGLAALKWAQSDALKQYQDQINLSAGTLPLGTSLEQAGIVYRERMNTIYACAVLNTKLRIHKKLMKQFTPSGSNIINRLETTSRQISSRLRDAGCRDLSDSGKEGAELSLKRSLIRDTTLEYCNYRHYLSYTDYNVTNRIGDVIRAETAAKKWPTQPQTGSASLLLPLTDNIAQELSNFAARSTAEIALTRGVFTEAFEAFREFDRNYASHVLMILIEDRYRVIREYLRDTMNPIGQVIYQASNATSPGK
jgi:hypothetical protein